MAARFIEELYEGRAFQGFHYDEILYQATTEYQTLAVYQAPTLGRVLVLDGIVQTTEADEFIYHEMLTHVPMLSVDEPKRVLIVGGGDGGVLREVLKHPIEQVDMVEIDAAVIECGRTYLPTLNDHGRVFDDPRTKLVIDDAFEYLKAHRAEYDVIIVDSTDPIGPAEALFSDDFYLLCRDSLSAKGAMSVQDGVVFFQRDEIHVTVAALRRLGLTAGAYISAVPTYYGGVMAFGIAARHESVLAPDIAELTQRYTSLSGVTRHYSPAVHVASFALPPWIEAAVEGNR